MSSTTKVILTSCDDKTCDGKSCRGKSFEIDKALARKSMMITQAMDEHGAGNVFPLHNVDSNMLGMVVLYMEYYHHYEILSLSIDRDFDDLYGRKTKFAVDADAAAAAAVAAAADADRAFGEVQFKRSAAKVEFKNWEATFVMVDRDTLFGFIRAADYLDIPRLLALSKKAFFDRFSWDIEIPDDISVIFDNMFESGISYDLD
ncbi:hypothetical protein Pint_28518 [Pistacia integerrima]|uniref:Uncharacterized protein n=1 Tax=Pistacia integerrima TaxID=434235 RepID=A0ACC0YTE5_9ROSI|nr:hypothetical protein Pint_28518 [Pistacia integerrima]